MLNLLAFVRVVRIPRGRCDECGRRRVLFQLQLTGARPADDLPAPFTRDATPALASEPLCGPCSGLDLPV